jgi:hypothetical protein
MENHVDSMEEMGGHQYPLGSTKFPELSPSSYKKFDDIP